MVTAMMALHRLIPIALATAACSDPSFDVTIRYAADLPAGQIRATTLAVVAFEPGATPAPTCTDVALGRVSADALAGGLRTSVAILDGGVRLTGVPRVGDKLFIIQALGDNGKRVAGGCTDVSEVTGDPMAITIDVVVAPRVRLVPSSRSRDPGAPFSVGDKALITVTAPWRVGDAWPPLSAVAVAVERRDVNGVTAVEQPSDLRSDRAGWLLVGLASSTAPPSPVGPVEVVIRAPWADQILSVPGLVAPPRLGPALALEPTARRSDPNRIDPDWVVVDDGRLIFAGLSARTAGTKLVVFAWATALRSLVRLGNVAGSEVANIAALAVERSAGQRIVTRTAAGWFTVDVATLSLVAVPGPPGPSTVADELIAVPTCVGVVTDGLLARNGDAHYEPFARAGVIATGGASAILAGKLNERIDAAGGDNVTVTASGCITDPSGVIQPMMTVREDSVQNGLTTRVIAITFDTIVPATSGLATFAVSTTTGPASVLTGSETNVDGAQLVAYTLVTRDDRVLAIDNSDQPVAAPAVSVANFDLDDDGLFDTVAAVEIDGLTRLQVTPRKLVDGRPLTGLTTPVLGVHARLLAIDLSGDVRRELLMMTSEGIAVFDVQR
jgi:hypothetical protein